MGDGSRTSASCPHLRQLLRPEKAVREFHLENITIKWLPANSTWKAQRLDLGVIWSFKARYRRHNLQKSILHNDAGKASTSHTFWMYCVGLTWHGGTSRAKRSPTASSPDFSWTPHRRKQSTAIPLLASHSKRMCQACSTSLNGNVQIWLIPRTTLMLTVPWPLQRFRLPLPMISSTPSARNSEKAVRAHLMKKKTSNHSLHHELPVAVKRWLPCKLSLDLFSQFHKHRPCFEHAVIWMLFSPLRNSRQQKRKPVCATIFEAHTEVDSTGGGTAEAIQQVDDQICRNLFFSGTDASAGECERIPLHKCLKMTTSYIQTEFINVNYRDRITIVIKECLPSFINGVSLILPHWFDNFPTMRLCLSDFRFITDHHYASAGIFAWHKQWAMLFI